jgi:hypothetical protein
MVAAKQEKTNRYPFWCSRFWHGMRFGDWLKLLTRNRFKIHPLRLSMVIAITLWSPFNSILRMVQQCLCGHRIARTRLEPPIFIVGHWRSGTTFLHELLVRDPRFTYPSTLDCFLPHHSLVSGWFFTIFGNFMLPKQRPQDNVPTGWFHPQEDEFALLNLGLPSPYLRMAFPNGPAVHMEYLDSDQIPVADRAKWLDGLEHFIRVISCRDPGKPVVLKSPPHLGRIEALAERFPGARFIHIIRHPYSVFPSTQRLWRSLDQVQGLQEPAHEGLDEYVYSCLETMYTAFERQRVGLPDGAVCDVLYEDLVSDPIGQVLRIYDQLELGALEPAHRDLEKYVESQRDFKGNRYELDEENRLLLNERWGRFFEPYGYELEVRG